MTKLEKKKEIPQNKFIDLCEGVMLMIIIINSTYIHSDLFADISTNIYISYFFFYSLRKLPKLQVIINFIKKFRKK